MQCPDTLHVIDTINIIKSMPSDILNRTDTATEVHARMRMHAHTHPYAYACTHDLDRKREVNICIYICIHVIMVANNDDKTHKVYFF